jgi:hypothetical protein
MDWQILVFIPSQKWGIKFTNICQSMLKLKTHSGFHDLFRFWYVLEYKYGSILWLEDGNLYLRLRKMSHTIYAANGKVIHLHWLSRYQWLGFWSHAGRYFYGFVNLSFDFYVQWYILIWKIMYESLTCINTQNHLWMVATICLATHMCEA